MKYGYDGAELSELIKKYNTSNDKIVITFLDGTNYEIPLTKENECKLLNQMIEQAYRRSATTSLNDLKSERKKALVFTISQIGLTILNIINSTSVSLSESTKVFYSILTGLTVITFVKNGVEYKFKRDEIKEIEKYDIYLSIKSRLENSTDPNIFNGVKKQSPLNINTLDSFSLNDIQRII